MLKFQVFDEGKPARDLALRNAYLLGADHSAIRGDISAAEGLISCQKREVGTAALAMQRPAGECGELTLTTCLLPERGEPYMLSLELARNRLMMVYNKLEEWGMFDLPEDHPVTRRLERARKLFIEAMCHASGDPPRADKLANDSLVAGIDASEELSLAHADMFLSRRKAVAQVPKHAIGCGVSLDQINERVRASLLNNFDFINLPVPWKVLAPAEGEYKWGPMDNWADWLGRSKTPVVAGPVVSFDPSSLPDWIYIWEHDYDAIRDQLYEHLERTVTRYRNVVTTWNVVSGLNVNSHLSFNFDQIMDLTRMCTMVVKKLQPSAKVLVEIRQPFGEYFGVNHRSIPPMTYADLLIQSAVNFDGFSLRLIMGLPSPGKYTRDLMQISGMLDQFSSAGKPVHLSVAAPSETVGGEAGSPDAHCGYWRKPWSPLVQSRWLEALFYIALSKPYIESVSWAELIDRPNSDLPMCGLIGEDLQPKAAYRRLVAFRRSLTAKPPMGAPLRAEETSADADREI